MILSRHTIQHNIKLMKTYCSISKYLVCKPLSHAICSRHSSLHDLQLGCKFDTDSWEIPSDIELLFVWTGNEGARQRTVTFRCACRTTDTSDEDGGWGVGGEALMYEATNWCNYINTDASSMKCVYSTVVQSQSQGTKGVPGENIYMIIFIWLNNVLWN